MSPPALSVDGLTKSYGGRSALRRVSLAVDGPGIVGLLGPNGAGKTTLLEILEGLRRPTAGQATVLGHRLGAGRYPKQRVGVVLQQEAAPRGATVREYADLVAAIYGVADGAARLLEAAGLAAREREDVEALSRGQAQRLFVAAACVHRPEVLFLDEPTAHLDPESRRTIGALIKDAARSAAVVLATHDMREAEALCDDVVFLVEGSVRARGTPAALEAAVPASGRSGHGLEDAFFHFCASRIAEDGSAS